MASSSILLRGGTILTHGAGDHVKAIEADLLIEGDTISKIEKDINIGEETEVIDCAGKILSPGFIDTHHHLWQTLLKGRHANHLLIDYFPSGNFTSSLHTPGDLFWGQLGGCLECLDVGTTTVVDHAHLTYSPDHVKAAIAATVSSGIRSVFGYCPVARAESWEPFTVSPNIFEEWVMATFDELASKAPFGSGRVQLGFAFDAVWLPKEVLAPLFERVREAGVKTTTVHYARNPLLPFSPIEILHGHGLLNSGFLFSHGSNATPTDCKLLLESNSHVASTPSTEMQMAMSLPIAFQDKLGIQSQCSLGVDCQSNNSASIVSEMRLLLQSSRNVYNDEFVQEGKVPRKINKTVEEAFNMGTIQGARAIGMEGKIGTLAVGKKADILIFDGQSPSMVCAAQHDPVAAVVLHSSPADIETVIVDGVIRKRHWMLEDVKVTAEASQLWDGAKEAGDKVAWKEVSRELIKRRVELQKKVENIDMDAAKSAVIKVFHIDDKIIVDEL